MSLAGVPSEHAERCLGHMVGSAVERTYNRHSFLVEMNRAFEALAGLVARIVSSPDDNVISLRG
jgi:hypothetical protein